MRTKRDPENTKTMQMNMTKGQREWSTIKIRGDSPIKEVMETTTHMDSKIGIGSINPLNTMLLPVTIFTSINNSTNSNKWIQIWIFKTWAHYSCLIRFSNTSNSIIKCSSNRSTHSKIWCLTIDSNHFKICRANNLQTLRWAARA